MKLHSITPRKNALEKAKNFGLAFNTQGAPYFDESRYYSFSLTEIEEKLEAAASEIHHLALKLIPKLLENSGYLDRLRIPSFLRPRLKASWEAQDYSLYGRFDFAYDGFGEPKLLEYNADTPTSLFEASVFQWQWLEELISAHVFTENTDQFNSIHDKLIARFKAFRSSLTFTGLLNEDDDRLTLEYLEDCAQQAGLQTRIIDVQNIGLIGKNFVDLDNQPISHIFKLYPYEWMLEEEFGKSLADCSTHFIEPLWKILLSNKALLVELWKENAGHKNLLPAFYAHEKHGLSHYVEKPLFSREGANICIFRNGFLQEMTKGKYYDEPKMVQQFQSLKIFEGYYPTLGIWMIGNDVAGMGIRDSQSLITTGQSSFVPHIIAPS